MQPSPDTPQKSVLELFFRLVYSRTLPSISDPASMSRFSAYAPTAHCAPSILSMVGLPSFVGVVADIVSVVGVINVAGVVGIVMPPAEVERS